MADFLARLESFLEARGEGRNIQQLTPDASTREYFRIGWKGTSAIACVYPEAFIAEEQPYLDVTRLFLSNGLPVAEILDFDDVRGVIVLEDMGDRILREEMSSASPQGRDELIDAAIDLIPQIQAMTDSAISTGSIASRLKFDVEKLTWELEFFKTHYFQTLKQRELADDLSDHLDDEFLTLSRELELRASVLCHRDFHAANLMIDKQGRLRIIDHQDARIGSAAYDLVSLLLDRVTEAPAPDWLAAKRRYFLDQRIQIGLPAIDESEFADEFRLQTIQRCLKAVGTFSYQSAVRGKTYFVPFIRPMFEIVHRAASHLGRYDVIRAMTAKELEEN
jgi:aminoglycoside/choline kinase family phosphotransferase